MRTRLITLHDGQQLATDDPEQNAYLEGAIAIPPSPRCDACGHQMCPDCGSWCDHLVMLDANGNPTEVTKIDDACDVECCCNGQCKVDRFEVSEWLFTIQPLLITAHLENRPIIGAAGPYIPTPILRARRLTTERIEDGSRQTV